MSGTPAAGPVHYTRGMKAVALLAGLLCHGMFAAAVVVMAAALFSGMQIGRGPFTGGAAVVADGLLLVSFPVLHSLLLSPTGRRWIAAWTPLGLGPALSTTIFATVASLQLLLIYMLWSPSHVVWWGAEGALRVAVGAGAAVAWLLLVKAMADAQLSLQTGFLGWSSVLRDRRPQYRRFATTGLYRHVRQPIYIAFAALLWLSAAWTPDQLALATAWTGYCVIGAVLKERRYVAHFGQAFRDYQRRVPFWFPLRD